VKVSNENGIIRNRRLSAASFHTQICNESNRHCYAIGKAIESFDGKEGKILCLIENGWLIQIQAIIISRRRKLLYS
jgi:hypothetical protein